MLQVPPVGPSAVDFEYDERGPVLPSALQPAPFTLNVTPVWLQLWSVEMYRWSVPLSHVGEDVTAHEQSHAPLPACGSEMVAAPT